TGGRDTSGLQARVEAMRMGEIAGTWLRTSAVTVADAGTDIRTFQLSVVPGTYAITVYPDDPSLPVVRLPEPFDLFASTTLDLMLPASAEYRVVTGRVVRSEPDRSPIAGAQVQGFDPIGWASSTIARTGGDGRFAILFPPGDDRYTVRVSRTTDTGKIPTVDRTG